MPAPKLRSGRSWLTIAVTVLSVAVTATQTQPTFHTEANYVRVDVYATSGGVPVSDLGRGDFDVLEDGVPQQIDEFSRVVIPIAGQPAPARWEPSTVKASQQAAAESASRVFVLFLDRPHVDRVAALKIRQPLVEMLDRLVGPDDLIAVMTPDMTARDLTFVRRTTTIERLLSAQWGNRDERTFSDPVEQRYADCYPGIPRGAGLAAPDQGIAQEMILRRREQRTFAALEDLVLYLRGVREERKAVLTISNGWRLFTPNSTLARPIDGIVPSLPPVPVDPRAGRLGAASSPGTNRTSPCDSDRQALAQLNEEPHFRQILDEANRANVSFYPIDPRGLAVFDEDIVPAAGVGGPGSNPMVPLDQDLRRLDARHGNLRTMAENTDGLAVVDNSNLSAGLRRVTDDLSAYYLLGYYSTGKLDGKFHAIRVRTKRAGVQIRTRRGYLAATTTAVRSASRTTATASTTPASEPTAVVSALGALAAVARDTSSPMRVAVASTPDGAVVLAVVADAPRGPGSQDDWTGGGEADAMLIDQSGATVASGHAHIATGATSVRVSVTVATPPAGDYEVRLRTKGAGAASSSIQAVRLNVPATRGDTGAVFFRRGPTTGNKELPTADLRFRRSDRLRVDVPAVRADTSHGRLLDRHGKPLAVPVASAVFIDQDGSMWLTAQVTLAPLAPGDYLVELASEPDGGEPTLAAFRVVP